MLQSQRSRFIYHPPKNIAAHIKKRLTRICFSVLANLLLNHPDYQGKKYAAVRMQDRLSKEINFRSISACP